mgnify:FL=1|jgi:hypothetical protein
MEHRELHFLAEECGNKQSYQQVHSTIKVFLRFSGLLNKNPFLKYNSDGKVDAKSATFSDPNGLKSHLHMKHYSL